MCFDVCIRAYQIVLCDGMAGHCNAIFSAKDCKEPEYSFFCNLFFDITIAITRLTAHVMACCTFISYHAISADAWHYFFVLDFGMRIIICTDCFRFHDQLPALFSRSDRPRVHISNV